MEIDMPGKNQFGLGFIDYRLLAPEQLERLKRRGMNTARQERSEALRALYKWLGAGLRRAAAGTWNAARQLAAWGVNTSAGRLYAFQAWRAHKAAIAALQTRTDRELADIGLRRSEIESVVSGMGRDPSRRQRGERLRILNREIALDPAA
jgi:uncharacterized protein YjiS (DUF1127 family)